MCVLVVVVVVTGVVVVVVVGFVVLVVVTGVVVVVTGVVVVVVTGVVVVVVVALTIGTVPSTTAGVGALHTTPTGPTKVALALGYPRPVGLNAAQRDRQRDLSGRVVRAVRPPAAYGW